MEAPRAVAGEDELAPFILERGERAPARGVLVPVAFLIDRDRAWAAALDKANGSRVECEAQLDRAIEIAGEHQKHLETCMAGAAQYGALMDGCEAARDKESARAADMAAARWWMCAACGAGGAAGGVLIDRQLQ